MAFMTKEESSDDGRISIHARPLLIAWRSDVEPDRLPNQKMGSVGPQIV